MAAREPVDDVAWERLLGGGADRAFSLLAALETAGGEMNLVPVGPHERPGAGGRQVPGPPDVTIRMADVLGRPGTQQADQSGPESASVASGDAQLDRDPEAIATPYASDERISDREDAVLQPERSAPEWGHQRQLRSA